MTQHTEIPKVPVPVEELRERYKCFGQVSVVCLNGSVPCGLWAACVREKGRAEFPQVIERFNHIKEVAKNPNE